MKIKLRPTFITHCDDGATDFEWCHKTWRFIISIEKNWRESFWIFVSRSHRFDQSHYFLPRLLR